MDGARQRLPGLHAASADFVRVDPPVRGGAPWRVPGHVREAQSETLVIGNCVDVLRFDRHGRYTRGFPSWPGEGNAEQVGVLDRLAFIGTGESGLAQSTPGHLLAQQLTTEGAVAEHVCYVADVPAFREHADGNHAVDCLAGFALLADGHEHVANRLTLVVGRVGVRREQLGLLGDRLRDRPGLAVGGFIEPRMDKDGRRDPSRLASRLDVREEFQVSRIPDRAILVAGDVPVQGGCVLNRVGDDDHHRRAPFVGVHRQRFLSVVLVELVQGLGDLRRERGADRPLLVVEIDVSVARMQVNRLAVFFNLVVDWDARHLDEARFHGVEQGEVRNGPREGLGF